MSLGLPLCTLDHWRGGAACSSVQASGPGMWRRRLSTWSSPTPLQQEAGWPSGSVLSSESAGVGCSGYKQKRAVTFLSSMPNSARRDTAGSLYLHNTPKGGLRVIFIPTELLTEPRDPSKSKGSLDVSQLTNNSSANPSAFSHHMWC